MNMHQSKQETFDTAQAKAALLSILRSIVPQERAEDDAPELAIAFSGGLDSRFLTFFAAKQGFRVLAFHVCGPHMQDSASRKALRWLEEHYIPHQVIQADILTLREVRVTGKDRCYHCKRAAFSAMQAACAPLALCDGGNISDRSEYRPGHKALQELGVRSPLAEAGLDKAGIKALAAYEGLDNPTQPSQTCLLTRFDYGLDATPEMLHLLDAAEEDLREILGDTPFRLRFVRNDADSRDAPGSDSAHDADDVHDAGREKALSETVARARSILVYSEAHHCHVECHVQHGGKLEGGVSGAVQTCLARHGFSGPVFSMSHLSGFFDRLHGFAAK